MVRQSKKYNLSFKLNLLQLKSHYLISEKQNFS